MYRELRERLGPDDVLVHIDFAENYSCKYSEEIQSVHFGGGHQQATLHTGVTYIANKPPISLCTISPCLDHGPHAIWSYLDPVMRNLKEEYPELTALHVFSDGPVTQYRQKLNFYLYSQNRISAGFTSGTWNYFEASHGKGAPDGFKEIS